MKLWSARGCILMSQHMSSTRGAQRNVYSITASLPRLQSPRTFFNGTLCTSTTWLAICQNNLGTWTAGLCQHTLVKQWWASWPLLGTPASMALLHIWCLQRLPGDIDWDCTWGWHMVTLTWWILKRNCESCKRAASVLQKGCLWSCKRAITLTLPHCALEKGSSCLRKWHHMLATCFWKSCSFSSDSYILNQQDPVEKTIRALLVFSTRL